MPKLKRIPRPIGDAALVVVVCLVAYTVAAALWGSTLPTLGVRVLSDMSLERVPGTEDARFVGFGRAILATSAIAFLVAMWAFATRMRSFLMMLWLGIVTGFGSLWFVVFGNIIARATHPEPTAHPQPGQTIEALTPIGLSSGLLLAPTFALLFYWVAASFISDNKF